MTVTGIQGQYVVFTGTLTNGRELEERTIEVLAGDNAPTVTGGWPEWVTLPRYRRVGMTVMSTYLPMKLQVPVRFQAILASDQTRPSGKHTNVEREIQELEWMAGRGRPAGSVHPKPGGVWAGKPGHDALGDSPLIEVHSSNGTSANPLVPAQLQSVKWVVDGEAGGIVYDGSETGCKRDVGGARILQKATVYLKEHVALSGSTFDSPAIRNQAREAGKGKGTVKTTTAVLDTINRMALHYTGTTETAREIIEVNRNFNKAIGTNPAKKLAVGTHVLMPYNALHHLSNG